MKFGVIRKEKVKDELKFDYPYLVVKPKPTEQGKVHKFWLKGENIKEILEFTLREGNKLSWIFNENQNTFYLVNVTSVPEDEVNPLISVNIALDFNNKILHEKLISLTGSDETIENYFQLVKVPGGIYNLPAVTIEPLVEETSDLKEEHEVLTELESHVVENVESII